MTDKIENIIKDYVDLPLECDGLTKVISYLLEKNDIDHKVFIGNIGTIHLWIEVEDYIIDYRARMWLGETDDIPHGIFKKEEYPNADWYNNKQEIKIEVSEILFKILTLKY